MGGDTVSTPGPLTLSITAVGAVAEGRMAARTGVKPGDRIYVSGTIGDAALGLVMREGRGPALSEADRAFLLDRYLLPRPRVALAPAMAAYANGGMDVSDGFIGDLRKMLRVSRVSACIAIARLPLSHAARAAISAEPELLAIAVTGGDDYELIASIPPESAAAFERAAAEAGVAVQDVGEAVAGSAPPVFVGADGDEIHFAHGSYSHY
jgi:thiamine-monophosphate kinase